MEKAAGHIRDIVIKKAAYAALVVFAGLILNLALLTAGYAEAPGRIISLAPSMTEILFAAGLGEKVVGVTSYCDHPEEAKARTKIGGM